MAKATDLYRWRFQIAKYWGETCTKIHWFDSTLNISLACGWKTRTRFPTMLLCIPFEMDGACALCSLGNINTHSSYCGVQLLRYIVYDMCVYRMRWNNPDRPIHKDYSWVFFVSSFLSSISVAGLLLVLLFFLPLLKASLRRLHFFHAMVVIQTPKIYKHSASDSVFGDIVDYRSTHSTIVQLLNNCCRQRSRFYYSLWWIVLQPNIRWFFSRTSNSRDRNK